VPQFLHNISCFLKNPQVRAASVATQAAPRGGQGGAVGEEGPVSRQASRPLSCGGQPLRGGQARRGRQCCRPTPAPRECPALCSPWASPSMRSIIPPDARFSRVQGSKLLFWGQRTPHRLWPPPYGIASVSPRNKPDSRLIQIEWIGTAQRIDARPPFVHRPLHGLRVSSVD
jgi:hypothetical protein